MTSFHRQHQPHPRTYKTTPTVVTVQALNVVLDPNLARQALATNGRATPATLFAAHIIPYARPFLRTNHWSR